MIIYGSRNKQLAKGTSVGKCPHCGTQSSIEIYVFQKYAHVFWVPSFPVGKTGVSQCNHCKQTLRLKEMSPELKSDYDNIKAQTKTPVWTFIGAALFAVLIGSMAFAEAEKSSNTEKFITHLQANDLLEAKVEGGSYTYLLVNAVKGDTVYLRSNRQASSLPSGVDKLGIADKDFYEDAFATTQAALVEQHRKNEIINVIRR